MFKSARIKLTAWYLLIIMFISICFSVLVFRIVSGEVNRFSQLQRLRFERDLGENPYLEQFHPPISFSQNPELILEVRNRLALILIITNLIILGISGILGYFLAGRTLRPIQIMVDEQNRFISDASHEFRTPLTALKSSMEVFLRDKEFKMDEAKLLIKGSIGDVDKLTALSTSLLDLAQYEKPNGSIKFEEVSLNAVIQESIARVAPLAKEKEISINSSLTESTFVGSKYSLIDLFVVLIENAVKYSKLKDSIEINSVLADGFVKVAIKDHGEGIDEKDIPHIFDRFYRADKSRSKSGISGYGLGLSIAKRIVSLHKGFILVESKLNEGTIFTVTLPTQ